MTKTDYPEITTYRYHFHAILQSVSNAELTAVGESIGKTVPAGHRELPMLVAAGAERRKELAESKEDK
jgi:hypothetical protein